MDAHLIIVAQVIDLSNAGKSCQDFLDLVRSGRSGHIEFFSHIREVQDDLLLPCLCWTFGGVRALIAGRILFRVVAALAACEQKKPTANYHTNRDRLDHKQLP